MKSSLINNYVNHVTFVIDSSPSMSGLESQVVKVFDNQIKHLARRSQELNQETRVSVYMFDSRVKNLIYDMDVLRLPSLAAHYNTNGSGTALIDAAAKALTDLAKTPELYGDHAFLTFVITDGEENSSRNVGISDLARQINSLADNWTVAVLVPNITGKIEAKRYGFPGDNIQVWDVTAKGMSEAGNTMSKATDNFMRSRAQGVRGTKNLFDMDVSKLNSRAVKQALSELNTAEYEILAVRKDVDIKTFVESWKLPFVKGSNYFQLTKPETVQSYKQICVQNKLNGKIYTGSNARQLLNLPDQEVRVSPVSFGDYNIFVQSTSANRKLVKGTQLIVLK